MVSMPKNPILGQSIQSRCKNAILNIRRYTLQYSIYPIQCTFAIECKLYVRHRLYKGFLKLQCCIYLFLKSIAKIIDSKVDLKTLP